MLDEDPRAAPGDGDEQWFEVPELEPARLEWTYAPERLRSFRLRIGPTALDFDHRYEAARALMADVVNAAREIDLDGFGRHVIDVWVGQRLVFGHYLDEMFITLAGVTDLPPARLIEPLRHCAIAEAHGRHPVAEGGFPELRISGGTIEGCWTLSEELLVAFSRSFQERNGLAPTTRDPYRQMASGESEPRGFQWRPANPRLSGRAIELVASRALEAGDVPRVATRQSLIAFGLTFDAFLHHASVDAAFAAARRVTSGLTKPGRAPSIDGLRTWLFLQAKEARDATNEIDLRIVKRALTALRKALVKRGPASGVDPRNA